MNNEYLAAVCDSPMVLFPGQDWPRSLDGLGNGFEYRRNLVLKYAWAIPSNEAIARIAMHSPLIEVGAGSGYWASLIADAGADIIATDIEPPEATYYPVARMEARKAVRAHPDRTLLMVWPPYDMPMAYRAISAYRGSRFIYVGEDSGGCTGDARLWDSIRLNWEHEDLVDIPRFYTLSDLLFVFHRTGNHRYRHGQRCSRCHKFLRFSPVDFGRACDPCIEKQMEYPGRG